MRSITIIAIILLSAMMMVPGTIFAQERNVGEFSSIEIDFPVKLHLIQGDACSVNVKADQELQEKVTAVVKNGKLQFDFNTKEYEKIELFVTFRELKELQAGETCVVVSDNPIRSEELKVTCSGAPDITLNLAVEKLYTNLEGATQIKLIGSASDHKSELSGAVSMDAGELACKTMSIEASGASNIKVDVAESLSGEASGASNIRYKNKPASIKIEASGVASIGQIGLNDDEFTVVGSGEIDDTTRLRMGNKRILIINGEHVGEDGHGDRTHPFKKDKEKVKIQWSGVHLGINGYVDNSFNFKVPAGFEYIELNYGRSWFVDLNPIEIGIPLSKKHVHIVTGLGFQFNNYRFDDKYRVLMPDTSDIASITDSSVALKKSKLASVWIQVPLLFQFDTKKFRRNSTFHVSLGVVGAVMIRSHTKQTWEIDGVLFTEKTRDNFELNPWRGSAMLKIGYGAFNVFATYSLSPLFKKGHGPELYPFTIGITVAGF